MIRREEGVTLHLLPVPIGAVDFFGAELDEGAAHRYARHDFAPDSSCRDPHGRFPRRGSPAAAIVPDAVFGHVGVIGMARPVLVLDLAVVLRALVGVLDEQRYRRASGYLDPFSIREHPGQNFDLIRFLPLRGVTRLAGPALVEIRLNVGLGQRDAGRTAIDDAADGGPMAFAPGGDAEKVAEAVMGHDGSRFRRVLISRAIGGGQNSDGSAGGRG